MRNRGRVERLMMMIIIIHDKKRNLLAYICKKHIIFYYYFHFSFSLSLSQLIKWDCMRFKIINRQRAKGMGFELDCITICWTCMWGGGVIKRLSWPICLYCTTESPNFVQLIKKKNIEYISILLRDTSKLILKFLIA